MANGEPGFGLGCPTGLFIGAQHQLWCRFEDDSPPGSFASMRQRSPHRPLITIPGAAQRRSRASYVIRGCPSLLGEASPRLGRD
jgi:hypothetical protein